MLTPGESVELELGAPAGSEAGLRRPAIVVAAERVLRAGPNVIQVVPFTRTIRDRSSEIVIEPDEHNGLLAVSAAQCQHIRSVATSRVSAQLGNVCPAVLRRVRVTVSIITDA